RPSFCPLSRRRLHSFSLNDTATTEIYTLSLHDALPISALIARCANAGDVALAVRFARENSLLTSVRGGGHNIAGNAVAEQAFMIDRKSTRLNSSHSQISYAVFCLKKKKRENTEKTSDSC